MQTYLSFTGDNSFINKHLLARHVDLLLGINLCTKSGEIVEKLLILKHGYKVRNCTGQNIAFSYYFRTTSIYECWVYCMPEHTKLPDSVFQSIPIKMDISWRVWRPLVRRRRSFVGQPRAWARGGDLTGTGAGGRRYTVFLSTNLVTVRLQL